MKKGDELAVKERGGESRAVHCLRATRGTARRAALVALRALTVKARVYICTGLHLCSPTGAKSLPGRIVEEDLFKIAWKTRGGMKERMMTQGESDAKVDRAVFSFSF